MCTDISNHIKKDTCKRKKEQNGLSRISYLWYISLYFLFILQKRYTDKIFTHRGKFSGKKYKCHGHDNIFIWEHLEKKNWKSGFLGNFSPLFPRMQGWSAAIPYLEAIPLVLTNKLSVNSSGLQNQYCQFSKFLTNGHKWWGKNKDFLAVKKNCKH